MKRIGLLVVTTAVLFTACSSPEQKAKKLLSQQGVAFTQERFLASVAEGHAEEVRLFLQAGMSPDAEERGITALMDAARRGHTDVTLALIDAGTNVSAGDERGVTPLMYAAISGSPEVIKKLIASGADVNARDRDGRTVLVEALTSENDNPPEIIRALIDAGADVNVKIAGGVTPLMLAAGGDPEVLRLLIAAGADVNARDNQGATALQRAEFSPENVKVLKEAGAKE